MVSDWRKGEEGGTKPNCQRGTVSTLEFRFETKLSTWINTIESFCRKLFICSLFDAKMVVSRFIFEFWRTGVSIDNRRFCPSFVAKCAPKVSRRQPLFCSLFAPKLSHFYSKIFGYRCIFMCWRNFVCPSNRRFEANCQRGTVSTLEFRFEAKLSTWISTLESFCRKLIFCSLFYAKMVVSRFIIEFWRTGVSVDNRKFCPIFVAKSAPKWSC